MSFFSHFRTGRSGGAGDFGKLRRRPQIISSGCRRSIWFVFLLPKRYIMAHMTCGNLFKE